MSIWFGGQRVQVNKTHNRGTHQWKTEVADKINIDSYIHLLKIFKASTLHIVFIYFYSFKIIKSFISRKSSFKLLIPNVPTLKTRKSRAQDSDNHFSSYLQLPPLSSNVWNRNSSYLNPKQAWQFYGSYCVKSNLQKKLFF